MSARMPSGRMEQYRRILKQSSRLFHAVQAVPLPETTDENYTPALAGSHVFGPALSGFMLWLLREAVNSGKKRLYFLARDGYFMYQAALIFCERLCLPLECRYLSCSRYSLRVPVYHLDHESALDYVCRGGIGVTLQKILARAGLTAEEQKKTADCLRLSCGFDDVLPAGQLTAIRRLLANCRVFLADMDQHSGTAYPFLCGYLRQEGLLDGVPDALVDSGWVGSMQKTLDTVLSRLGRTQSLSGYYWGLYGLPPEAVRHNYHWYDFGPGNGLLRKAAFNNCLFEAVFTAPHGMTVGYREENGVYLPCYGGISEERVKFIELLGSYILAFIRVFADQTAAAAPSRREIWEARATAGRLLAMLMKHPSAQEAQVFGQIPFSDDVLDGKENFLAAQMTEQELMENHLLFRLFHRKSVIRQSAWYEGSAVRDSARPRRHIRGYTLYQYLLYLDRQLRYRFGG